ncbi:MAG: sialidase family protein, partial [Candidatus Paceibacterota bacterium]
MKKKKFSRRNFLQTAGSVFTATTLMSPISVFSHNGKPTLKPESKNTPKVRWTATKEELNFRYDFVKGMETTTLYKATPDSGMFSHHQYITQFKGVLIAAWDNHIRDENGSGQRSLFRISTDKGDSWDSIEELFPPLDKEVTATEAYIGSRTQKLNGFVTVDGVIYALSDVADWAGPSISDRYSVPQGLLCRSVDADGTLGDIFIAGEEPYRPVDGFPSYPAGKSEIVKKIQKILQSPAHQLQLSFDHVYPYSDDNHRLGEPTAPWELSDGTLVKLYRDNGIKDPKNARVREASKSRRNYASFSYDEGKTWTTPVRTGFPDCCARTNTGVLPGGQVYVINNVLPLSTKYGGRTLLAISLSDNGLVFDRVAMIRFNPPPKRDHEGRAKSFGYQYPHSVVFENNLWVLYS